MPSDFSNAPAGGAICPCEQPELLHWLEIELHDEEGFPVPYEEYQVILPDGETVRGYLDDQGWARLDPIQTPGTCVVSFPNLDKKIWSFETSKGPKYSMGVEI